MRLNWAITGTFFFLCSFSVFAEDLKLLWVQKTNNPVGLVVAKQSDSSSNAFLVGSKGQIFDFDAETGKFQRSKCSYAISEWRKNAGLEVFGHKPTRVSNSGKYLLIQTLWALQQLDLRCESGMSQEYVKYHNANPKFAGFGGFEISGAICDHLVHEDLVFILECDGKITSKKIGSFEDIATGRPLRSSNTIRWSSGETSEIGDTQLRLFRLGAKLFVTGTTNFPFRENEKPTIVEFDPDTLSKMSERNITCENLESFNRPEEKVSIGVVGPPENPRFIQISPGLFHNSPLIFTLENGSCIQHTNKAVYSNWDLRTLKVIDNLAFHGSALYDVESDRKWELKDKRHLDNVITSCSRALTSVTLIPEADALTVTCFNYSEAKYELDTVLGFKIPSDLDLRDKSWGNLMDKLKSIFK